MEEQKYLKKKIKALNGSNKKYIAEACTELGDFYNGNMEYEKASKQYEESAEIYCDLGMRLEYALSNRMIGEMYMLLAEFEKALLHEDIYLTIACELGNKIEEQRALATLGRAYLLRGQSFDDKSLAQNSLKLALKSFTKSLMLCEKLRGKINYQEFMDMRARLLLNIGIVSEHLDEFEKAMDFFHNAINICKKNDLHELLAQCYISEGLLHSTRYNDYQKCLNCLNYATEVASRLENKSSKQCEIFLLKAETLCKISDFQSAKNVLLKAWKLKTPNESDQNEIERVLRIVAALCYTEDEIITTDTSDHKKLKKLYEKMGDGVCSLNNYDKGIYYYIKMLENAELAGDADKELCPIYVSLYQTYKDIGDFENAIKFLKMEYEIIKCNPNESINSLLNLAEILKMAKKPVNEVESVYLKAKEEAIKQKDEKNISKCMKKLISYLRSQDMENKASSLMSEMGFKENEMSFSEESSEEEVEDTHTPMIGDEIRFEDLTDLSGDEEAESDKLQNKRKRGKRFSIKKNAKGETQLHQACISGNGMLVTHLISQGHPVNVRDNAGWLPIHEACIHGHRNVVEILIKNGANINDRGGTQCDGITPLYDAASNGHLDIMELLLDNGASPAIKTDSGDTPLNILYKWREHATLDASEDTFYEIICSRIQKNLEKLGSSPSKIIKQFSTASMNETVIIDHFENSESEDDNVRSKSRKIIDDDNSDSQSDGDFKSSSTSKSAVNEYKYAISALRKKPSSSNSFEKDRIVKPSRKSALLDGDEVGDDWLENDIQIRNKRRRQNSDVCNLSKRKSGEGSKTTQTNIAPESTSVDLLQDGCDSSYVFQFNSGINNPWSKLDLMKKSRLSTKPKHQISLIKAGFSRNKTDRLGSQIDNNSSVFSVNLGSEPDSTSETNQTFASKNPTEESCSKINTSQSIAVKVRVNERYFLIPVILGKIDTLKINWLSKEASRRYYNIEGVEPVLHLMTNDGAMLGEDDPLSIVVNSPELQSTIVSWNLPLLSDRYVECCKQFNNDVDDYLKAQLEASQATHMIKLTDLNLTSYEIKPVFKALNHQSNLTNLILMNNNLGNGGIKHLVQCLPSLINLVNLNLSGNCITSEAIKLILNTFEDSSRSICENLQELDVSYNPLGDMGFLYFTILTKFLRLKVINLCCCDISCSTIQHMDDLNLQFVQNINLSFNSFGGRAVSQIFHCFKEVHLTSICLEAIDLSGGVLPNVFEDFACSFIQEINMSRCNLQDNDINELLRSTLNSIELQKIILSYNPDLTFKTLQRLLSHPNVIYLNLEGCVNIFKNLQAGNLDSNLFTDCDKKLETLNITTDNSISNMDNIISCISLMWQNFWGHKALIKKSMYNFISYTVK